MLFDTIPEAKMPEKAPPPTRAQDILEAMRHGRQRTFHLGRELEGEQNLMAEREATLMRLLRVGETVELSGVTARRVRGGLQITWGN